MRKLYFKIVRGIKVKRSAYARRRKGVGFGARPKPRHICATLIVRVEGNAFAPNRRNSVPSTELQDKGHE